MQSDFSEVDLRCAGKGSNRAIGQNSSTPVMPTRHGLKRGINLIFRALGTLKELDIKFVAIKAQEPHQPSMKGKLNEVSAFSDSFDRQYGTLLPSWGVPASVDRAWIYKPYDPSTFGAVGRFAARP